LAASAAGANRVVYSPFCSHPSAGHAVPSQICDSAFAYCIIAGLLSLSGSHGRHHRDKKVSAAILDRIIALNT